MGPFLAYKIYILLYFPLLKVYYLNYSTFPSLLYLSFDSALKTNFKTKHQRHNIINKKKQALIFQIKLYSFESEYSMKLSSIVPQEQLFPLHYWHIRSFKINPSTHFPQTPLELHI
jgi:hypothetical protein